MKSLNSSHILAALFIMCAYGMSLEAMDGGESPLLGSILSESSESIGSGSATVPTASRQKSRLNPRVFLRYLNARRGQTKEDMRKEFDKIWKQLYPNSTS